jgi:hypothetical protein
MTEGIEGGMGKGNVEGGMGNAEKENIEYWGLVLISATAYS